MCTVPLAIAALSVGTTGYGIYQTNKAADAAFDAQNTQAQNMLDEQQTQATEELGARMKEYRRSRARARVAGGESGAQGQSFAVGLNQMIQDADEQAGLIAKNLSLGSRATLDQLRTSNASVRTVSGLEAGLQIASSGVGSYYGAKASLGKYTPRTPTIGKATKNS